MKKGTLVAQVVPTVPGIYFEQNREGKKVNPQTIINKTVSVFEGKNGKKPSPSLIADYIQGGIPFSQHRKSQIKQQLSDKERNRQVYINKFTNVIMKKINSWL